MSPYRYIAQRIGTGQVVAVDLPLTAVVIEHRLSGVDGISFKISPELSELEGSDGRIIFKRRDTLITVENGGQIVAGAIVDTISYDSGDSVTVECIGPLGVFDGMPAFSSKAFVQADPAVVCRWLVNDCLVHQTNGALQMALDTSYVTSSRIGKPINAADPNAAPYIISPGSTQSVLGKMGELSGLGNFDYYVDWAFQPPASGSTEPTPLPTLRLISDNGTPVATNLIFKVGENVMVPPVRKSQDGYCTNVLYLGAGDGDQQIKAFASANANGGVGRWEVITNTAIGSTDVAQQWANGHVAAHSRDFEVASEVVVKNSENAPIPALSLGQRIVLDGSGSGFGQTYSDTYKIVGIRHDVDADEATLSLAL